MIDLNDQLQIVICDLESDKYKFISSKIIRFIKWICYDKQIRVINCDQLEQKHSDVQTFQCQKIYIINEGVGSQQQLNLLNNKLQYENILFICEQQLELNFEKYNSFIIYGENKVQFQNIFSEFQSQLLQFIQSLSFEPLRNIYLSRHGQSLYNLEDRIGGDSDLSPKGMNFSLKLNEFFSEQFLKSHQKEQIQIYSSTLIRAKNTAKAIQLGLIPIELKCLDEINAGLYDHLTYKDIENQYPQEAIDRSKDKLRYRYPEGESYLDLVQRILPFILILENSSQPIIVVAHQAILRVIYAYLMDLEISKIPHLEIPLHHVFHIQQNQDITMNKIQIELDTRNDSNQQIDKQLIL